MNIETAIINVLSTSPVALVLFWMVYIFNKKDESKNEQLKVLHSKFVDIIENNTHVITGVKQTIEENTRATQTLSDRIYDVLTKKK